MKNRRITVAGGIERDWVLIRHEYESGSVGLRVIAKRLGIPANTMFRRAKAESWLQARKIVAQAAAEVRADVNKRALQIAKDQLAPWIEKQKEKLTRRSFKIAARGFSRVEKLQRVTGFTDTRDDANIAKTAETYNRVARVALGMSDGQAPQAPLSIALLGSHNAVQIVHPGPASESQE